MLAPDTSTGTISGFTFMHGIHNCTGCVNTNNCNKRQMEKDQVAFCTVIENSSVDDTSKKNQVIEKK